MIGYYDTVWECKKCQNNQLVTTSVYFTQLMYQMSHLSTLTDWLFHGIPLNAGHQAVVDSVPDALLPRCLDVLLTRHVAGLEMKFHREGSAEEATGWVRFCL